MNKLYVLKEQTEKRTILYIGLGILLFHGTDSYGRILLIYFLNRTSMENRLLDGDFSFLMHLLYAFGLSLLLFFLRDIQNILSTLR